VIAFLLLNAVTPVRDRRSISSRASCSCSQLRAASSLVAGAVVVGLGVGVELSDPEAQAGTARPNIWRGRLTDEPFVDGMSHLISRRAPAGCGAPESAQGREFSGPLWVALVILIVPGVCLAR